MTDHKVSLLFTETAIERLDMCDRGKRALALLYELHKEVCGMDTGNLLATRSLVEDMTAGTHNGTIMEMLRPYKIQS